MKVKCINAVGFGQITFGKIYDVVEEVAYYYRVRDNNGDITGWTKDRFEIVENKSLEEQFKEACKFIGKTVQLKNSPDTYKVADVVVLSNLNPTQNISSVVALYLDNHDFCVALISGISVFPYQDAKVVECIEYVLNKDHTAKIYKDKVVVSCQTFDLNTIKDIVKKAESLD